MQFFFVKCILCVNTDACPELRWFTYYSKVCLIKITRIFFLVLCFADQTLVFSRIRNALQTFQTTFM